MIVFDLACPGGHVFEAWFGSSDDYERQRTRGLVSCPLCGAGGIEKAVMAPAVSAKSNQQTTLPAPTSASMPMRGGASLPAEVKAALTALAQAQVKALEGSEHVGKRFADEARAIHAGDAPERVIHGQATREEATALIEEGVAVAPLPFPIVAPEQLQ